MQMPMENLIGLRGPVGDLLKNLGWLLAFQTTFIAIFGCIPRAIGSIAFHHVIARSQYLSSTLHFLFKYIIFANFDLTAKDGEPHGFSLRVIPAPWIVTVGASARPRVTRCGQLPRLLAAWA